MYYRSIATQAYKYHSIILKSIIKEKAGKALKTITWRSVWIILWKQSCSAKQMTDFYMKRNTGPKWINQLSKMKIDNSKVLIVYYLLYCYILVKCFRKTVVPYLDKFNPSQIQETLKCLFWSLFLVLLITNYEESKTFYRNKPQKSLLCSFKIYSFLFFFPKTFKLLEETFYLWKYSS